MFLFSILGSLPTCQSVLNVDRIIYMEPHDYEYSLTQYHATYSTARNASTGGYELRPSIGQWYDGVFYYIWRSYLHFDTSILPSNANITEAKICLYLHTDSTTTDFNITIQTGGSTYPHFPLEGGDYFTDYYSGDGGTFDTSTLQTGYNEINLNSNGISWINKTAKTGFCFKSDRDINSQAPTGTEVVAFYDIDDGEDYTPKLLLTYDYEEEESSSGGDTGDGEPTTIIDIPEITVPKFHIPIWGYYLILGSVFVVALTSLFSKAPKSKHGPNGTKIKRTQKRYPKRNKKGRFT